jgi:hypothetical protein
MSEDIQCALTGIAPTEEEAAYAALPSDDDDVETIPPGWSVVVIKRRLINPRWLRIQQRMQEQIQAVVEEAGEDTSDEDKENIQLDIEAMYSNLLINTPATVTQIEEVYLAPPERHQGLPKALTDLAATLDVDKSVFGVSE